MNRTDVTIDFTEGLNRFAQQEDIYHSTLRLFFTNYDDITGKVENTISEKGYEAAAILLHGIKGAAALLGFTTLAETLQEFDQYLRGDEIHDDVVLRLTEKLGDHTDITQQMVEEYIVQQEDQA